MFNFAFHMGINEKQLKILQVTERLFSEHGFDGTSVRTIAKQAQVNIAMISYYFGSKEKLLESLLYYRSQGFKAQLKEVLAKDISHLKKIDEIVAVMIERVHKNRRIYKILHFESTTNTRRSIINDHLIRKKETYKIIESFINDGQKVGVFSKDVNIKLISSTILGTYFNFYYNHNYFKIIHGWDPDTSIDHFVKNELTQHIQITIKALLTYEN